MGYNYYCYRPTSSTPSSDDAEALIRLEEAGSTETAPTLEMQKIATALIAHNPRLVPFKIEPREVAKLMSISVEQAKIQWNHIELNLPEGDALRIQLTVHTDHVSISIPYWYTGVEADEVFEQLLEYLRVIRKAGGYFAYDPQTGEAFDPDTAESVDHREYDRIAVNLPAIVEQVQNKRKPWWRFW